jgi:hypothetical protein
MFETALSGGRSMSEMNGMALIEQERRRQIDVEGWTAEHDDVEHDGGEMLEAARCYLEADGPSAALSDRWPWDAEWWKPGDRARNLARAGALLMAERDRIQRRQGKMSPFAGIHHRRFIARRLSEIEDEIRSVAATLDSLN